MEIKHVYPSGDIHFTNFKGDLIRAELLGGIIIDYTTKPKRVYLKR